MKIKTSFAITVVSVLFVLHAQCNTPTLNNLNKHPEESYTEIYLQNGSIIGALGLYATVCYLSLAFPRSNIQRFEDALWALRAIPIGAVAGAAAGGTVGFICDATQYGYNNPETLKKIPNLVTNTALNIATEIQNGTLKVHADHEDKLFVSRKKS
jgi:hypothetical protein